MHGPLRVSRRLISKRRFLVFVPLWYGPLVVFFMMLLLGAPSSAGVEFSKPISAITLTGGDSTPSVWRIRKSITLTVNGPGTIELSLMGLRQREKRRLRPPGRVMVRHNQNRRRIRLAPDVSQWALPGTDLRITLPQKVTLTLQEGSNTVQLRSTRQARAGFLLAFEVRRPVPPTPPKTVAAAPPPPPPPVPDALPIPETTIEDEGTGIDIPESPLAISAGATGHVGSFRVEGELLPKVTVEAPRETATFYHLRPEQPLAVKTTGPGTLVIETHAPRDPQHPESLEAAVVAILVDEVLTQTVAIDQPVNGAYESSALGAPLSERVVLRIPIPAGDHTVRLTQSETAVLGLLMRPDFDTIASVAETTPLTLATPPPPAVLGSSNVAIMAGTWFNTGLPNPAGVVELEANLGFPFVDQAASIGLSAAFTFAHLARTYTDPRVDDGLSRVRADVFGVPLLADVRWSVAAAPWLTVTMGLGGGVIVSWSNTRSLGVQRSTSVEAVAAARAQVSLLFALGPGKALLRGAFLPAGELNSAAFRQYSPGGLGTAVGYQFDL